MNKTEIKKAINKAVIRFAESLGYEIHDHEVGSSVIFCKRNEKGSIEYDRSEHTAYFRSMDGDKVRHDADKINKYAEAKKKIFKLQNKLQLV